MQTQFKRRHVSQEAVLRGVEDVIKHLEGDAELLPDFDCVPQQDVKAIRNKLNLSQSQFAGTFGIPLATVKNWEQGRRTPDQPANVLLFVISQVPDVVASCLQPKQLGRS